MYTQVFEKILTVDQVIELTPVETNRDSDKIEPLIRVSFFNSLFPMFDFSFWDEIETRINEVNINPLSKKDEQLIKSLRLILAWYVYASAVKNGLVSVTAAGTLLRNPIDTESTSDELVKLIISNIEKEAGNLVHTFKKWLTEVYYATQTEELIKPDQEEKIKGQGSNIAGIYFKK